MTRSRATRSSAISVAVLILLAAGWLVFAPTRFGGSTDYVTTHGISMEPRFHTGDLALIRRAAHYRVGDVVAYHSELLHTVVLHRIIGRDRDRYVFKGDNNDFIDPTHPARSELLGKLWIDVHGGGAALGPLRSPPVAGLLIAGVAAMFLLGAGAKRRRRTRRRSAFAPVAAAPDIAAPPPPAPEAGAPQPIPVAPTFVAALAESKPAPAPAAPVGAIAASAASATRRPVVASAASATRRPVVAPAPPALPAPAVVIAAPAPTRPAPRVTLTPVAPDSGPAVVLRQTQPSRPRPLPPTPAAPVVNAPPAPPEGGRIDRRHILSGSAVAALVFLVLGLLAFAHATTKPVAVVNAYSESFAFGYHAAVPPAAAAVYPGASLKTGDPVFLRLVHRVQVTVGYRFAAGAPHRVDGTLDVVGRISGPTGWTREIRLSPARAFSGDRTEGVVTLDLLQIRKLTREVERLTGMPSGGTYTLAVVPRVRTAGTVAGRPLDHDGFSSQMSFQLDGLQLRPGGGPAKAPSNRHASVTSSRTATNTLGLHGHELAVRTLRGIALGGLLLAALAALIGMLPRFRRADDPSARIQARYRHLIVPIAGIVPNPAHAPIDVATIDALVALAERGERLILHHRSADTDTYLLDDAGTLFRHRIPHAAAPAGAA